MSRAEKLSALYADAKLNIVNPELAVSAYSSHNKMRVALFDGNDIKIAFSDGYEQAVKDIKVQLNKRYEDYKYYYKCNRTAYYEGGCDSLDVLKQDIDEMMK